ncbi:hypothetical protein O3G_MSEX007439, partial [Manduca sexta]
MHQHKIIQKLIKILTSGTNPCKYSYSVYLHHYRNTCIEPWNTVHSVPQRPRSRTFVIEQLVYDCLVIVLFFGLLVFLKILDNVGRDRKERRALASPDGDKDADPLLVSLLQEGSDMMTDLRHINLKPQQCYRSPEPINLYHKVGHGTLDMYVLNPSKDSKHVREFLKRWHNSEQKLFEGASVSGQFNFPIPNLVSICALLVWRPANPDDTITRIMFPGSTPQHKIFEGLEKLKHLEFLQHPTCTGRQMATTAAPAAPVSVSTAATTQTTIKTTKPVSKVSKERSIITEKAKEEKISEPELPLHKDKDIIKDERDTKNIIDNKLLSELVDGEDKQIESVLQEAITARLESKLDDKIAEYESTVLDGLPKKKDLKKKTVDRKTKRSDKTDEIKAADTKKVEAETRTKIEMRKKMESRTKTETTSAVMRSKVSHRTAKSLDKKMVSSIDKRIPEDKKSPPTTPKKTVEAKTTPTIAQSAAKERIKAKTRRLSPGSTPAKSAKEASNRRVVESKYKQPSPKRDILQKSVEKKEPKAKREPISRRPRPLASPVKGLKAMKSPTKAVKSVKADTSKLKGLQRVNYEDILKDAKKSDEDTSKSLDDIKQQELDEREEQEIVREIEAVFNRDSEAEEKVEFVGRSDIEKITCMLDDTKTETTADGEFEEEYLIIEKEEVDQYTDDYVHDRDEHEDELQKHLKDKEESEKKKDEVTIPEKGKIEEIQIKPEVIMETEMKHAESKEPSVSVEEKQDISSEKKTSDSKSGVVKPKDSLELNIVQESQPDEKVSTTIESGATTAPTLPEDERITLDDIKEDQQVEEKHVQEETKEVIPPQTLIDVHKPTTIEKSPKREVQQIPIREIVKTPDEVADLPLHEEVDYRTYEEKKTPIDEDIYKRKPETQFAPEMKVPTDLPLPEKDAALPQKVKSMEGDVVMKTVERPSHAEVVTVTPGSAPESPMYHDQVKMSIIPGKELKPVSEYGDGEFDYGQYTEKLRETHITTLDSPIKDDIIVIEEVPHMPEKIPSIPEDVEKEIEEAQKLEIAEKPPLSPKDVEKIVADVAEVLKSDKSLEEIMAEKSPISARKSTETLFKTETSAIEATKMLLTSEKEVKHDLQREPKETRLDTKIEPEIESSQKEVSPVRSATSEDVSEISDKTVLSETKRASRDKKPEKFVTETDRKSTDQVDFSPTVVVDERLPEKQLTPEKTDLLLVDKTKISDTIETKKMDSFISEKDLEITEAEVKSERKLSSTLESAKTLEKLEEKIADLKRRITEHDVSPGEPSPMELKEPYPIKPHEKALSPEKEVLTGKEIKPEKEIPSSLKEISMEPSPERELQKREKAPSSKEPSPIEEIFEKELPEDEEPVFPSEELTPETLKIIEALKDFIPIEEPEIIEITKTEEIKDKAIIIRRVIVTRIVSTKYGDRLSTIRKLRTDTTITTTDNFPDGTTRTQVKSSSTLSDIKYKPEDVIEDSLKGFKLVGKPSEETTTKSETVTEGGVMIKRQVTVITTIQEYHNLMTMTKCYKTIVRTITEDKHADGSIITRSFAKSSLSDESFLTITHDGTGLSDEEESTERGALEDHVLDEKIITLLKQEELMAEAPKAVERAQSPVKPEKLKVEKPKPEEKILSPVKPKEKAPVTLKETLKDVELLLSKEPLPTEKLYEKKVKEDELAAPSEELSPETLKIMEALKDYVPIEEPEIIEIIKTEQVKDKAIIIRRVIVTRIVSTKYDHKISRIRKLRTDTTITTTDNLPDGTTRTHVKTSNILSDIPYKPEDIIEESLEGFKQVGKPKEDTITKSETVIEDGIIIKRRVTVITIIQEYHSVVTKTMCYRTIIRTITEDEHPDGSVIIKTSAKTSLSDKSPLTRIQDGAVLSDEEESIDHASVKDKVLDERVIITLKPEEKAPSPLKPEEIKVEELKPEEKAPSPVKPEEKAPSPVKPEELKVKELKPEEKAPSQDKPEEKALSPEKLEEKAPSPVKPEQLKIEELKPKEKALSPGTLEEKPPSPVKPEELKIEELKPKERVPSPVKPEEKVPSPRKPEELQVGEIKPEEKTPSLVKPEEKAPSTAKPEELKVGELKPDDKAPSPVKPEELKVKELKPEEKALSPDKPEEKAPSPVKPEEKAPSPAKPEELKVEELKPEEKAPSPVKPEELKPKEKVPSPVKPEELKVEELKPKEKAPSPVKPEELKDEELKPKEKVPSPVKPEEKISSPAKPEELKVEELKPEEKAPSPVKPEELKDEELKPEDKAPSPVKPEELQDEELKPKEKVPSPVTPEEKVSSPAKPEELKVEELKPKEKAPSPVRREEIKVEELKPEDKVPSAVKPEEKASSPVKPEELKVEELKVEELKSVEKVLSPIQPETTAFRPTLSKEPSPEKEITLKETLKDTKAPLSKEPSPVKEIS